MIASIILAAGKGTRMKSKLPKVLHKVAGRSMLGHVLAAAKGAGATKNIIIVGFGADEVKAAFESEAECVYQAEQLGTAHAVGTGTPLLANTTGTVIVLCGDTPLLTADLLKALYQEHKAKGAAATVLAATMPDATGYGRIIRNDKGELLKIVEQKDASEEEKQVKEVSSGIFCFEIPDLIRALPEVTNDNAQGEYYLPDVLDILRAKGKTIAAFVTDDYESTLGVNSRVQLSQAEAILRERKNTALMDSGVTIIDPKTTYIDCEVTVGQDTVILPNTYLEGSTTIGSNCEIGPGVRFTDMQVGNNVKTLFSYAHGAVVDDNVDFGPYVHLRPDTHLKANVHVGNFTEVKNSTIGEGSKLAHLQYIGDADIGDNVNCGCGTVTANYDGKNKYRTTIGNDAFIGCQTCLVAPVSVGDGAYTAAGSVITKDVTAESLAVGRAKQTEIKNWQNKRK